MTLSGPPLFNLLPDRDPTPDLQPPPEEDDGVLVITTEDEPDLPHAWRCPCGAVELHSPAPRARPCCIRCGRPMDPDAEPEQPAGNPLDIASQLTEARCALRHLLEQARHLRTRQSLSDLLAFCQTVEVICAAQLGGQP